MIDPSLLQSYNEAKYHVFDPDMVLKIGESNPVLDKLLIENGNEDWAFITASNPRSSLLSDGVNGARFALLKEVAKSWFYFEGEGVGSDPEWKPEQSLLILGIKAPDAIEIGKSFDQNAIVVGKIYSPAELIIIPAEDNA